MNTENNANNQTDEITSTVNPEEDTPPLVEEDNTDVYSADSPEYTYVSRKDKNNSIKRKKKSEFKKGFRVSYVLIPVISLGILLGLFLSLPKFLPEDTIASNLWSGSISLEGLTTTEAETRLIDAYVQKSINFSVIFEHDEKQEKTTFNSEDIAFTLDPQKTAQAAFNFGRSENIFKNSWDVLRSFFTNVDIGMVPSCNTEKLSEIFYELGATVHGSSKDAEFIIENNILTITPATPGQSHDVSLAINEFLNSTQLGVYHNIPITLKSNENDKLDADELYTQLSSETKNAEYKIENNTVTITDHVVGVSIDKAKLSALVDKVNQGIGGSIDVIQTMPETTKEALQKSLFGTTLASFSSSYASSSANRAYNVELASSKVNGIVLADGAEFSYNSVIGNPNAANGYKMATVFADGKSTEGVGGGVCQVSSTLYCAVLRSDLAVVERRNHSLPVGYVPGGQDATVAYGSTDFRFKNNTGAPIKLVLENSNRKLTVSILGSQDAKKKVDVVSEKISTIEPTMTEIQDPTLPVGQTKVITKGKPGSSYVTYKRVYDANGNLVSETKTRSTYKATAGEIAVGTAEPTTPAVAPTDGTVPSTDQPNTTPSDTTIDTNSTDSSETQVQIPENASSESPVADSQSDSEN